MQGGRLQDIVITMKWYITNCGNISLTGFVCWYFFFLSEILIAYFKIPLKFWIMFFFLLPDKASIARSVYVGVLRLDICMLKCNLRWKHNTLTAVIIAKTLKEKNGTHCFFLMRITKVYLRSYKGGIACKRSYSGGRLLKSFLRHGHIVPKWMQETERKIDLSSCTSYIWTKKKHQLNERHSLFPRSNLFACILSP